MSFFKRPARLIPFLILLTIAVLLIIKASSDKGPIKEIIEALFTIGTIYTAALTLVGDHPVFQKLDRSLKKIPFLRPLLPKKEGGEAESNNTLQSKEDMLFRTAEESVILYDGIKDLNIFSRDFDISIGFEKGTEFFNHNWDWEGLVMDKRLFQAILGDSGMGKSFELIKRLSITCQILENDDTGPTQLADKKVPVFIPLRSLSGPPDEETILQYLTSEGSLYKSMSEARLRHLIRKHQLIYFFDGLDEVGTFYHFHFMQNIVRLAKETSVFFTCRRDIYNALMASLDEDEQEVREILPAKYYMEAMSREKIFGEVRKSVPPSGNYQEEILAFIATKDKLLEYLAVPLILNLFLKVFGELTDAEKQLLQVAEQQKVLEVLWCKYEDYIIQRKHKAMAPSDIIQNRTYTVWMAKIMGRDAFDIDTIQPNWLKKIAPSGELQVAKQLQLLYYLTTRIIIAVLIGISVGAIIATPGAFLGNSVLGGLVVTILGGLYKRFCLPKQSPSWQIKSAYVFFLSTTLIFCCGAYQGFAVPRETADMATSRFSFTEATGGILLGLVLGVFFSYRIIFEAFEGKYVVPIEKYKFDWPHAWKEGLVWGIFIAAFVGAFAIGISHFQQGSSFITRWLTPTLDDISMMIRHKKVEAAYFDLVLFTYAFIITFTVSFLIIVILASRYQDIKLETAQKNRLNFGIKASAWAALTHSFVALIIVAALYSVILLLFGHESIGHGINIGFGMAIVAFLWAGGMEVLNHVILRLNLFWRGIAPLNYDPWFKVNQDMALIKEVGPNLSFYHNTLADYFSGYQWHNNDRIKLKKRVKTDKIVYTIVLIGALYLLLKPFEQRYFKKMYWVHRSEFSISPEHPYLKQLPDSTFFVEKSGQLAIAVSGEIHIGTFTGYAPPEGITAGFMGIPLKAAYNWPEMAPERHASFLFNHYENLHHCWSGYDYASPKLHPPGDKSWLKVTKGDSLKFYVNDREWQNNSGLYQLTIGVK